MSNIVLILSCSSRKHPIDRGVTVPAGCLYDGAMFRVVKAWLRRQNGQPDLRTLILSAKYGLISWETPVATYDQRMTIAMAQQLAPQVDRALSSLVDQPPERTYVELGSDYLTALADLTERWPNANVTYGYGRIGQRMQRLKHWLECASAQYG